jgi:hypothetical protein
MYFDDHNPPHFHAIYGEYNAQISIRDFALLEGYVPPKALSLVIEWASIHKEELMENWNRMLRKESFKPIEPLQ